MGEDNGKIPVYYSIKELRELYKRKEITYKELMLYEHCPKKVPIKEYKIIEHLDTRTMTFGLI